MIEQLRELQRKNAAVFEEHTITPISYGNDSSALCAATEAVALCDRSDWGILKIAGEDRLNFLHNQTTNDFKIRKKGEICETVFVTSTARNIDLVTAYINEDEVLLIVSPNRRGYLIQLMDRYIFPLDRVEIKDISQEKIVFSLIGPNSKILLEKIQTKEIPQAGHVLTEIAGVSVRIGVGNDLDLPGYNLIIPVDSAAMIWSLLTASGGIAMGTNCWESLRVTQGRPAADKELTEEYNPLETGLWQTISFNKGCYIGQETIARLNTYDGVKQRLWGIQLKQPVKPGTAIKLEDTKIGVLTSFLETEKGYFGLGYIRRKAGGLGLKVSVGETTGEVVKLAFVQHKD